MSAVAMSIVALGSCDVPYEVLIVFAIIFGIGTILTIPSVIKRLFFDEDSQKQTTTTFGDV